MANDATETLSAFQIGGLFADYTLKNFCGRGAYGEVYIAEDISGKEVAIKIIPITAGDELWKLELIGLRYYRQNVESHPALVQIYHVGEHDGYFYYTMEPADNLSREAEVYWPDTLGNRLESGRLSPEKTLQIAFAMLDALDTLNRHSLMHRDLKPANIIFVNGAPKLSDVGLITDFDANIGRYGTIGYLPPEVADGSVPGSPGNDFYALGKVLYCSLTGLTAEQFPELPLYVPMAVWMQLRPALLRAANVDPKQRFFSAGDFRRMLPKTLRAEHWYDRVFERCRAWRRRHPRLWRTAFIGVGLWAVTLAVLWGLDRQQLSYENRQRREQFNYIFMVIGNFSDHLAQLERYAALTGSAARLRQIEILSIHAGNARSRGDYDTTERYCRYVLARLQQWSEDDFRRLQDFYPIASAESRTSLNFLLAVYEAFNVKPLARYLTPESRNRLRLCLSELHERMARVWSGPRPGRDWLAEDDPMLRFIYVAPDGSGAAADLPYWIAANELTQGAYGRFSRHNPSMHRGEMLPVESLCWNDYLEFAQQLTESAAAAGKLPEGYLFRLPYVDEWSFAARGGWRGTGMHETDLFDWRTVGWFGRNSDFRTHAVRQLAPNALQIYDCIGNVGELVLQRNDTELSLRCYGGSFRDQKIEPESPRRYEETALGANWVGMRLVLGAGTRDYFSRYWYTGRARTLTVAGRRFELLGSAGSRFSGAEAQELARLTGGRVAKLDTPEKRRMLQRQGVLLTQLPCLVGASRSDAGWRWADGQVLDSGEWLELLEDSGKTGRYLTWDHDFWRPLADGEEETAPLLLLEWDGAAAVRRPEPEAGSLLVRKIFTVGTRRYLLLKSRADWYAQRRIAELLGGKLAVVTDEAQFVGLQRALTPYSDWRIALGGYRRLGEWRWLDGRDGPNNLPAERKRKLSLNQSFIGFYQGRLHSAEEFDGLLCELEE